MQLSAFQCDQDNCGRKIVLKKEHDPEEYLKEGWHLTIGPDGKNRHTCGDCAQMPAELREIWYAADMVRNIASNVEQLGFAFEECVVEDHGEDCEFHVYPDESTTGDPKLHAKIMVNGCGLRRLLVYRADALVVDWFQGP